VTRWMETKEGYPYVYVQLLRGNLWNINYGARDAEEPWRPWWNCALSIAWNLLDQEKDSAQTLSICCCYWPLYWVLLNCWQSFCGQVWLCILRRRFSLSQKDSPFRWNWSCFASGLWLFSTFCWEIRTPRNHQFLSTISHHGANV
jgi:hypothetical protein